MEGLDLYLNNGVEVEVEVGSVAGVESTGPVLFDRVHNILEKI